MITLAFDAGKTRSVLKALADPKLRDRLVKVAAETYVDATLDWIAAGRAFKSHTGILEQSIGWRFAGGGEAEVFAQAEYAGFVEHGTRPHVIEPKAGRKALKIPSPGNGFFFAGKVNHPGSKPHPFFFADQAARQQRMQSVLVSVLAAHVGSARG